MLDKNEPLGEVCPIQIDVSTERNRNFPKDGWTVFVLELVDDSKYELLRNRLPEIEGRMLLFTNRLTDFCIYDSQKLVLWHSCRFSAEDTGSIVTQKPAADNTNTDLTQEYIIVRHPSIMSSSYPARPSKKTTITIIAFPYNSSGPIIEGQQIFTFLPLYRTFLPVSHPFEVLLINSSFFTQSLKPKRTEKGFSKGRPGIGS